MFYVQRDAQGALVRVEAIAFTESTETLPADHMTSTLGTSTK